MAPQRHKDRRQSYIFKELHLVGTLACKIWSFLFTDIPQPNLEIFRRSLTYSEPKIWNTLPEFVRDAPSLDLFKQTDRNWRNVSIEEANSVSKITYCESYAVIGTCFGTPSVVLVEDAVTKY